MDFNKRTVGAIFGGMDCYRVPSYQRSFAWGTNQVSDFWRDVSEADERTGFYLGTIILHKEKKDSARLDGVKDIVDGQQRMTAITLLYLACRNYFSSRNIQRSAGLNQTLMFSNIATGAASSFRLEAASDIREALKHMVSNSAWDGENFPDSVDLRSVRRLKSIYQYFKSQVDSLTEEQITSLLFKLQNSYFLVIEIEELMQAFELFERTNARGTPLNAGDLLKNRIFASANENDREMIEDDWNQIVLDSEGMLLRMLKYFAAQKHGKDTGKLVLYRHLSSQVNDDSLPVFISSLKTFSSFFNRFVKNEFYSVPFVDRDVDKSFEFLFEDEMVFKRFTRSMSAISLFGVYVVLPVAYAGIHALSRLKDEKGFRGSLKAYLNLLSTIESFHFVNNQICTRPSNTTEALYATSARKLSGVQSCSDFKAVIDEIKKGLRGIGIAHFEEFRQNFIGLSYDNPRNDKPIFIYIFDRLESSPFDDMPALNLFEASSEFRINRIFEIEHITPKSQWDSLYGQDKNLNNIGNLLPIKLKTNRLLDSHALPEKIKILKEKRFDNLETVKDFVAMYEQVDMQWLGPKEIRERAERFAEKAYNDIWNPWI